MRVAWLPQTYGRPGENGIVRSRVAAKMLSAGGGRSRGCRADACSADDRKADERDARD